MSRRYCNPDFYPVKPSPPVLKMKLGFIFIAIKSGYAVCRRSSQVSLMLWLLLLPVVLLCCARLFSQPRLLRRGKPGKRAWRVVQGERFYLEESIFSDYQQAIHGYFRLTADLMVSAEVVASEYDFFDFYSVVLRFEDCTLALLRRIDTVRLVKSAHSMEIDQFRAQIASIAYADI